MAQSIKFQKQRRPDFVSTVRERAEAYFNESKLSRHATAGMWIKNVLFLLSIPLLYVAILYQVAPPSILLLLAILLGIAQIMTTINLGHDALHGSMTSNSKVNQLLGRCFDCVGLNSYIWKMTHNVGHHTFTNIHGADPDIDKPVVMRLSPHETWYWFHRYQHVYAWFLYALIGINWLLISDFIYLKRYWSQFTTREVCCLFGFKLLNLTTFLIIPLSFMTLPTWQIVVGYLAMQAAGGFTAAVVFQLAHIVEEVNFPLPDAHGSVEADWGAHQMATTANFGTGSKLLRFFFGGLNFQVEHHLMPYVAHGHYPQLAPMVKATAHEYGLPYLENPSFTQAIVSHYETLKRHGARAGERSQ